MTRRCAAVAIVLLGLCTQRAVADGNSCTISATSVVFGNYIGSTVNITGSITVRCTSNASYYVGLNAGIASGATVTNRNMTGPNSVRLGYRLFSNSGYTQNWGDSSTTGWVGRTYNGNAQTLTVYAQIPGTQTPSMGTYNDTITATVTAGENRSSTTFSITATVVSACTLSASPIVFPTYTGVALDSSSSIVITCTNGKSYNVGLNAGTAPGATVTNRSMTGPGGALLGYRLFRNATYATNWGNTVGVDTAVGVGTGLSQLLTVYGQISAGQLGPVGTYTDTITATITY